MNRPEDRPSNGHRLVVPWVKYADWLEAENASLKKRQDDSGEIRAVYARLSKLEAEVEKADLRRTESETTLWARIKELEAERDSLRAALQKIADNGNVVGWAPPAHIAEEALK
jgi:hypothetical protein